MLSQLGSNFLYAFFDSSPRKSRRRLLQDAIAFSYIPERDPGEIRLPNPTIIKSKFTVIVTLGLPTGENQNPLVADKRDLDLIPAFRSFFFSIDRRLAAQLRVGNRAFI